MTRPGIFPAGREELRHGYTFADLHDLARSAVLADRSRAMPYRDSMETALSAIAVALYEATDPPTRSDLIGAGWRGIYREIRATRRQYGYQDRQGGAGVGSAPMFARYWHDDTAPWVEGMVERIATGQVHAAVPERDRVLLDALAVFGDNRAAAAALGMRVTTYATAVCLARKRWIALWHDGETPAASRHRVRPHHRYDESGLMPCGTHAAYRRHLRRREPIDEACAGVPAALSRAYRAGRKAAA